jgi:phthalate 4,5-cis-dihydrodiol dehydrogenase
LTVVSCERGDIRQSPDGLLVYDERGQRELPLPAGVFGRELMVQELYDAIFAGVRPLHDGRWGKATLEVSLAIMASARERREVVLVHQTPVVD